MTTKFSHSLLVLYVVFYMFSQAIVAQKKNDVYIVYMGANNNHHHDLLLNSLLRRNRNGLVHNYKKGFSGFAARLTKTEAEEMGRQAGVVSVFPDPMLQLHTTRSWDFLKYGTSLLIDSTPVLASQGSDTIVGILDTGIWPESESFNDIDMSPIPPRWKGTCMDGPDFNISSCTKKLIGARFYKGEGSDTRIESPRDALGHGTHVSSTAAGVSVPNASYYGLANGAARGGSPTSHIAMYRVCYPDGCPGSAILAAFDDAISDGVDLLSLSLGASAGFAPDFSTDPIAIGAFHAVQKGITVVCSAGNQGPSSQTVVNEAPWILTVAATTIDRDLESDVVLGNNKIIKGESINFSELEKSPIYPLISGVSAKTKSGSDDEARNCYPNSLDGGKIKGKIVICEHGENSDYSMRSKINAVKDGGGLGIVIVNDPTRLVASNSGSFPMTVITSKDAAQIFAYMNSTENAVGTILATKTVPSYKPAPTVAFFSSRGPASTTKNLLKPDIAAPGVSILAAWMGNDTSSETTPKGRQPPQFKVISGTSMSCPHVAGIAANIKSQNPSWSPAAIKSAIMTSAIQNNNLKATIATESGNAATAYDIGAGEVSPTGGLQPGLIYEINTTDYLYFLCYYGYNLSTIKLIATEIPSGFSCPEISSIDMISNINYPSIAVTMNASATTMTVKRTVTNVGSNAEIVYTAVVDKPAGIEVDVSPRELKFTSDSKILDYKVTFSTFSTTGKGDLFGAITWTNKEYQVRSPFVVARG
ncbi:CO(2)-response secreted protease [Amaranthus tricolor]|uniref:CO(2)-response secreted protease n=1 Tax=Amaranthus tricolor TaxID=29722 RepID=UPI00258B06AB|nr:CO(2)-response secreted protease [Amaranthus tricolor]